MSLTLYGIPGSVYAPPGGASYTADPSGRIPNVPVADAVALRAAGCLDQASWLAIQSATTSGIGPQSTGVTVYTLSAANNKVIYPGALLVLTANSGVTLNVPFGLPFPGRYEFVAGGTGDVTPTALAGVTINNVSGYTKTAGQYSRMELIATAPNAYLLTGDGSV